MMISYIMIFGLHCIMMSDFESHKRVFLFFMDVMVRHRHPRIMHYLLHVEIRGHVPILS